MFANNDFTWFDRDTGAGTYMADTANAVPLLTQARAKCRAIFWPIREYFLTISVNPGYFCQPAVTIMQLSGKLLNI